MYVLYTYGLLDVDLSKWSAINDFAYHSFSFAEILCWEKKTSNKKTSVYVRKLVSVLDILCYNNGATVKFRI